ncbi:MAG: tyrosine-type recombinase/integrase [Planctomycetota bacterium]
MATLLQPVNGRWAVQVKVVSGKRHTIRLGKVTERQAGTIKDHIEGLAVSGISGMPPSRSTAAWVAELGDVLHARLAKAGLVPERKKSTLGEFVEGWLANPPGSIVEATRKKHRSASKHLVEFFGPDRDLRSITAGDAERWFTWMRGERGLAEDTARKSVGIARQIFKSAEKDGLIDRDAKPLADLPGTTRGNRDRMAFITKDQTAAVLEACSDGDWRLLVCLARYGGLRVCSETDVLRWSDIDWEAGYFTVHASKTRKSTGGGVRKVPIFEELYHELLAGWERAEPGTEYVIEDRHRGNKNLGTHFKRIIERAGMTPWPKPWQNLRASRATEVEARWGGFKESQWIGHSPLVARRHYLQITEEDYRQAAAGELQNPVQHLHADGGEPRQTGEVGAKENPAGMAVSGDLRGSSVGCGGLPLPEYGPYRT